MPLNGSKVKLHLFWSCTTKSDSSRYDLLRSPGPSTNLLQRESYHTISNRPHGHDLREHQVVIAVHQRNTAVSYSRRKTENPPSEHIDRTRATVSC